MEEKQLVSLYINTKQIFRNGFEITYDFKLKCMKGFFRTMVKISFLLPDDATLQEVRLISQQQGQPLEFVKAGSQDTLRQTVDGMLQNGTEIFISRGFLAKEITALTTAPVVELRLTRMEIYELICAVKSRTRKERPRIAIVCSRNMLCDITGLDALAGVELVPYLADEVHQMPLLLEQAVAEQVDGLITGVGFGDQSQHFPIPCVRFHSGREAVLAALRMAKQIAYTLDMTRAYNARQQALLDYTVNGLVLLDQTGRIEQLNPPAEQMLRCTQGSPVGQSITQLASAVSPQVLQRVLTEHDEVYALRQRIGKTTLMLSLTPVSTPEGPSGAVLSITEGQQIELYSENASKDTARSPAIARTTFATLPCRSARMQAVVEKARRFSGFAMPVFLSGEAGTEKEELAFCMYNASSLQDGDFVSFHCSSEPPDALYAALFGESRLVHKLRGVLYLDQIQALSPLAQSALAHFLESQRIPERCPASLWVIAAADQPLDALQAQGLVQPDLACVLAPLCLTVPPLRQRPDDALAWAQAILKQLQPSYGRYLHLTQDAWKALRGFSWPGNKEQLYGVCQRILVEAPRRTVTEETVRSFLPASAAPAADAPAASLLLQPEEQRLRQLLRLYDGNRAQTARALGISTTTLWRKMKKYGLT